MNCVCNTLLGEQLDSYPCYRGSISSSKQPVANADELPIITRINKFMYSCALESLNGGRISAIKTYLIRTDERQR